MLQAYRIGLWLPRLHLPKYRVPGNRASSFIIHQLQDLQNLLYLGCYTARAGAFCWIPESPSVSHARVPRTLQVISGPQRTKVRRNEIRKEDVFLKLSRNMLSLVVMSLLAVLALGASVQAEDSVIASINGREITRERFYEALESEFGAMVLQQMIIEELLSARQDELGVEVTDEMFSEYIMRIVSQLGGEAGLQQFLAQNQISMAQLEEQIYWNLLLTELTQAEVEITDEELEAWFEDNKERFDIPEQVKASHILLDTEEEAEELRARVEDGEAFADLAEEFSLDPGSGPRGGDLGFFGQGMMVPEFEALAFEMGVGDMGIVESSFGWHLILVTDKAESETASLEDSYDDVRSQMKQELAMDPNAYLMFLMESAEVDIQSERYQDLGF